MEFVDKIKELFEKKYKVEKAGDGFYQIVLKAKAGNIYQHGKDTLAVHLIDCSPSQQFSRISKSCPLAKIHVMGEKEIIITHPIKESKKFISVCKAYPKKVLSEEIKEKLRANIAVARGKKTS